MASRRLALNVRLVPARIAPCEERTMVLARGHANRSQTQFGNERRRYRLALERLEDRCLLSFPALDVLDPNLLLAGLTPGSPADLLHQHSINPDAGPLYGVAVPNPPPRDPNAATVRKDQSTLTDTERTDFVNAVLGLKNKYEDGSTTSVYDEFVLLHQAAMRNLDIHVGPAFFPWHREFLDLFERELQTINPQVTIPYWNWAVDGQTNSPIWNDDFMGGDGDPTDNYVVKSGPFRQGQWTLITDGPDLRRSFGVWVSSLPTAADEAQALTIPNYDVAPYDSGVDPADSFRNFMLGWNSPTSEPEMHNRVHNWVGGSMLTEASPNDPVFWLVHANLDRIWADWEAAHGYLYPDSGAPDGENLNDTMRYLDVTPASVLNHHDLGYQYDTEQPGPRGSPSGPGDQNAPVLVHAVKVGQSSLFHQHHTRSQTEFGNDGSATINGEGLLEAVGIVDLILGGHAGHGLTGAIASPDFMVHSAQEAGHPGGPVWAHAGMASVGHAAGLAEHGPG
jgi:tyrosinase